MLYAFVVTIAGQVRQFEIRDTDGDGLLDGLAWSASSPVGSEAEGCVADDDRGVVYMSKENVGLWRYGAEPGAGTVPHRYRHRGRRWSPWCPTSRGSHLVDLPNGGGYLIVSAQNAVGPGTTPSSSPTTG